MVLWNLELIGEIFTRSREAIDGIHVIYTLRQCHGELEKGQKFIESIEKVLKFIT
jgi:hypothetical protein